MIHCSRSSERPPWETLMSAVIETHDLAKNYGNIQALRGVTLTVQQGNIYGLLGQNGAGKTTLIKILLGIAQCWEGEASLLGAEAGNVAVRKQVGYLPEDHRFPDYHTAYTLLDFYGTLLGVSGVVVREAVVLGQV